MKFRNKETGKISLAGAREDGIYLRDEITKLWHKYELPLLAEHWEYYEEPKDIWWLDNEGCVNHASGDVNDSFRKNRKIGNYFKTKEEAELAVRKLKAWKRLKDNGFKFKDYTRKFDGFERVGGDVFITAELHDEGVIGMIDELTLLFGGKK